MWSVWSESVDLYLGQTVAMLRLGRGRPIVVPFPATLSTKQALAQLADAIAREKPVARAARRNLRVVLSGALCPAIGFTAPQEVTRWRELRDIAHASAAMSLGVNSDQLECEMDASLRGVASAIQRPVLTQLQHWAEQHHWRITAIEPIWAVASQCRAVRPVRIRGLLVQEPDAISMISQDGQGSFIASTLPVQGGAAFHHQANTRRWLVGHGLAEGGLVKLSFNTASGPSNPMLPTVWASHWTMNA